VSAFQIPKESTPDIKFGIISINTIYRWVDPVNVDSLITQKIEKKIKDIDGIKKITSNSSLWFSNIIVELENEIDVSKALVEIKDGVDKTILPSEAEEPSVTEVSSNNEKLITVLLIADKNKYDIDYLRQRAESIQLQLEWKNNISNINVWWWLDMDIELLVDRAKAEKLWLSLSQIANTIRVFNNNQPLWNHSIWDTNYDFSIKWELTNIQDILDIPVIDSSVKIGDIAIIKKKYTDQSKYNYWKYQKSGFVYLSLEVEKTPGSNIFQTSSDFKKNLETLLKKQEFKWLDIWYVEDASEIIKEDYESLFSNWLQTILLVFIVMILFVSFKEALIASITIPIAFLLTFFVLNQMWLSLNFLTNFSLIISFGIAIDVVIVLMEWAHEKMKLWYWPKNAILLAIREYKRSLISWTMTTLLVFLPMFTLPGILWKFLAYIPITIFCVLLAWLILSLTVNSGLYYVLSKSKKKYEKNIEIEEFLPKEEKDLLEEDRKLIDQNSNNTDNWIKQINIWWLWHIFSKLWIFREKVLKQTSDLYWDLLVKIVKIKAYRLFIILWSFILFISSFIIPKVWFVLFPSDDNPYIRWTIVAPSGKNTDSMVKYHDIIDQNLSKIPEIKHYYYTTKDNKIQISIELYKKQERIDRWLRLANLVEKEISDWFKILATMWVKFQISVSQSWPPWWKAVWVKIIAEDANLLNSLIDTAKEFENQFKQIPWTKNVWNSSQNSPGQFLFFWDNNKLWFLGLRPSDLEWPIYSSVESIWAGSIKGKQEDYNIKVSYEQFENNLNPNDILNLEIPTQKWNILVWNLLQYETTSAIANIQRENTRLVVIVDADLEESYTSDKVQPIINDFAKNYNFTKWIYIQEASETAENQELLVAMASAFGVAMMLIYGVLLLQFNSFGRPAIIMYSILMSIIWVNYGLWIVDQNYWLPMMIWFISLAGVVVNDAIVFIEKIDINLERWMDSDSAIIEWWKSRLHPIIVTTLTTVIWLSTIVTQDAFFANLWWTIIFGLMVWSISTLFTVPVMFRYYIKKIKKIK